MSTLGVMPKHLLLSVVVYIASRGAMAALAPMYETGIPQFTSPVLMFLFIGVAVLFVRRVKWTWTYMQCIAFTEIGINALFFPKPEFHGAYTTPARLLVSAIIAACCVILLSLDRSREAKAWFGRT